MISLKWCFWEKHVAFITDINLEVLKYCDQPEKQFVLFTELGQLNYLCFSKELVITEL